MDLNLPRCDCLLLDLDGSTLFVTLNRPQVRNAMNKAMASELAEVFGHIHNERQVRTVVLRGAEGNFCAGGDVKEMAAARASTAGEGEEDPLVKASRLFGGMITKVDRAPQAVIAVLEGAVMGGGLGLACVVDVAIARADTSFRLPETSLGLPPAQIAAFLVQRLGLSRARRLAVTGGRLDGRAAHAIGLIHEVCDDGEALETRLQQVLDQIDRCAPGAIATTKELMRRVGTSVDHGELLDQCAVQFAEAVRGPEGTEGTMAFIQKRPPAWRSGGK